MKCITTAAIFILFSTILFGQHETDQRVIGFKYKLNFNATNPQVETTSAYLYDPFNTNYKGDLKTPHANSICDTLGNLLFYYDGTSVYQPNGAVMQNGTLHDYNFSSYYNNVLIVPIEESNRRYYYLFETIPHPENWDYTKNTPSNCPANIYCFTFWDLCKLQYSIIDVQANAGNGAVSKKNIFVIDSVAPSISGIKHQNNIDTWVSVLKYHTNKILNYKVNSCAIQGPIISSIPDFEYKQVPLYVSSYSPAAQSGFQIVYSTKGDYVAFPGNKISDSNPSTSTPPNFYLYITPFNNQTGLFDFSTLKTITVKSGYDANLFSHDSKYLYYHDSNLFAPVWIYQYELTTGTSLPFYYNNNIYHNSYSGVDYGKQNDLLIYKLNAYDSKNPYPHFYAGYLGQLKNIDQPFISTNLIDSLPQPVYDQPIGTNGNLINYISRNNYIYNFYNPDYKKPPAFSLPKSITASIPSPACFTVPISLAGHSNIPSDSMYWLIKKETGNWQKYTEDTFNLPVTPATYKATYVSFKYCLSDSAAQQFLIEDYPQIQLPIDTAYTCDSKAIDLPEINTSYSSYWINSQGNPVNRAGNEPGQYSIVVKNSCGTASDSIYIKNSLLDVTNLVTANNDQMNDCLNVTSNNVSEKISLSIYNCWGSRIFYDTDYKNNWCPDTETTTGVYFYETTYNNNCSKKGWVQVIH